MNKPPKQPISNYLYHRRVLSEFGVDVNYDLPVRIQCPLPCVNTHDMYIAPDSLFGAWFTCKECGFTGDALELYKLLSGLETMDAAITKQMEAIPGDSDIEAALGYYSTITGLRDLLYGGNNVIPTTGPSVNALVSSGLYGGDMRWLSPFLTVKKQKELKALGLKGADIRGNTNIVIPCCDQPGRVRSVIVVNKDASHSVSRVSNPYLANDNAGIAFLHNVSLLPPVRTLYLMEDIVTATVLHRMYYMSTGCMLPLCVYTAGSDIRDLQHIEAAAIVMIPDRINTMALENATTLESLGFDVYVTDRESVGELDSSTAVTNIELEHLSTAGNVARKLDDVMAEYIAETGTRPYFLSPDRRRKLQEEDTLGADQVRCGKYVVADKPDGLYIMNGRKHKGERVSNVKIIPESLITVDGRRSPVCNGRLQIGTKSIQFSEYVSVINRAPAAWVRSQLHWFPKDTPEIHTSRWAYANLCQLGIKLCAPEHHNVPVPFTLKRKEPKMMFPNFIVTDEHILPRPVAGAFAGYPCLEMEHGWDLPMAELPKLLAEDPANEVLWAVMICMIYNIISPYYGMRPMSFALSNLPDESTVLEWYTSMLGLPVARHPSRFTERTTTGAKLDYRLPLHLQLASNYFLVTTAAKGRHAPCVVSASEFDADMLAACPGWWKIDASDAHKLLCDSDLIHVIPEIIHAIFKQPYKIPTDPLTHIAEVAHAWLRSINDGLTPNVLYKAVHRITTEPHDKNVGLLATTIRHLITNMAEGRIAPAAVAEAVYVKDKLVIHTAELRSLLHMLWPGAGRLERINMAAWLGTITDYTILDSDTVEIGMEAANQMLADTGVKFDWAAIQAPHQDDSKDSDTPRSSASEPASQS